MNSAPDPAVAQGPKPAARILVVDDDRLVLATVTHGLSKAGYDVIDADNGDDAILLAREHRPQLALLDIRMEGKSGFDVAETLRDAYGIPFMFLSAFSDPATLAKVQALGAQAYLIKPLDVGQIVPSVAAVLARLEAAAAVRPLAAVGPLVADAGHAGQAADGTQATNPGRAVGAALGLSPAVVPASWGDASVAMATGVLMHRYSLLRADAARRLQRLAEENRLSLPAQAERLLTAVEELARSSV